MPHLNIYYSKFCKPKERITVIVICKKLKWTQWVFPTHSWNVLHIMGDLVIGMEINFAWFWNILLFMAASIFNFHIFTDKSRAIIFPIVWTGYILFVYLEVLGTEYQATWSLPSSPRRNIKVTLTVVLHAWESRMITGPRPFWTSKRRAELSVIA